MTSTKDVEDLSTQPQKALIDAFERNCRVSKSCKGAKHDWFNNDLRKKRKLGRKLWNICRKLVKSGMLIREANEVSGYRKELTECNKLVKISIMESWKKKCESIESTDECSRLVKFMSGANKEQLFGCLVDTTGKFTKKNMESLKVLYSK